MGGRKEWLDIRDLLRVVNGVVALLMLLAYPLFNDSTYVNQLTLLVGLVLLLQIHLALSKRIQPADPFVLVLFYFTMTYYAFRIVTLAVFNTSDVFPRFPYDADDTNYALAYIIACNASMQFGFSLMHKHTALATSSLPEEYKEHDVANILRPLLLALFLSVIATASGAFEWIASNYQILRVLIFFLRPTALLVLIGVFYLVFYQKIPRRYFCAYFLLHLLVGINLMVIGGVRGQIIFLIETFLLILIANDNFFVSRRVVCRGLILTPLLALILVVVYNFATFQRNSDANERAEVVVENVYRAIIDVDSVRSLDNIAHMFSRAGFLDFSAEIIAHKHEYREIFNVSYYGKSIVDNVLTPGFDYYDVPKISYSLYFKHQNLQNEVISKSYLVTNNIYHSDQLGIYGEMYALCGWYSLIILCFFAYALKWVYYNLWVCEHRCLEVVKRTVILCFFVGFINSFGLDWVAVQILPFVFAAFLLAVYLRRVELKNSHEASV